MAATLADKAKLSVIPSFVERVRGAMLTTAVTVASEGTKATVQWTDRRTILLRRVLEDPVKVSAYFAAGVAATTAVADAFSNATGTDDAKVAAITDTQIQNAVTAGWDVVAGVPAYERGA